MDGGNVTLSSIKMFYVERCREMKLEKSRARANIKKRKEEWKTFFYEKNVRKIKPKKKREKEKD